MFENNQIGELVSVLYNESVEADEHLAAVLDGAGTDIRANERSIHLKLPLVEE